MPSSTTDKPRRPTLALTMGEPAGIGPEITVKAWRKLREHDGFTFVALADPEHLRTIDPAAPLAIVAAPEEAADAFAHAVPVLPIQAGAAAPGKPSPATAAAVIRAIREAVALAQSGRVAGVVTNPIQKSVLYDAGFRHPGHTEFIAELCGVAAPIMMLAVPGLRVVPLTIHVPLREVARAITHDLIVDMGLRVAAALRHDFAIAAPRLAVAGLNPHAGEDGKIGTEERDIIAPAIAELNRRGIDARGPYPPDSMFAAPIRAQYDAALCMYHDQALIPLKALDFDHGVNITLGLPIVRTSPDHGTALDIAGQNMANADSLIAALRQAAEMAAARAGS